ncbi:MAG: tetratricopeptide repeat protein [Gemmatales bacterium]
MNSIIFLAFIIFLPMSTKFSGDSLDDTKEISKRIEQASRHYAQGEYELALRELDVVLHLDPKNALAYSCRGTVRFARKEYDLAITDLNAAITLEPDKSTSGYSVRGAAYYMKREYARGCADFEQALRINPNDIEALNSRAWAAATCPDATIRNRVIALKNAKRVCEMDGMKNPYYIGTLAAAYAENSDFEKAVEMQRKALQNPNYSMGKQGKIMLMCFEKRQPYRDVTEPDK